MKTLTKYLNEKLIINKDYKNAYTCAPKTFNELRRIIEDRYDKFGPGTKQKSIDFNDVDISNIDSFFNIDSIYYIGIFEDTKFKYIDISDWDVSNVERINRMFLSCEQLKSVGDISDWDVSKVKRTNFMFYGCEQLKSVGDLSDWNVLNVKNMSYMFYGCKQLKSVGDLSNWNVSNVEDKFDAFSNSGITNIPKWYRT